MIEVEGLTKRYGELVAVDDLSFTVGPGEVVGLVGHNGAGKTTTLRSIAGIIHPTEGRIRIAGHDLGADPARAKQELAFVPDDPRFFDLLTVREHLRFMARLYQVERARDQELELLERLELLDKADQLPEQLSRGMRQKLAIACAMIHDPRAILFDEPLSGLDPGARRRMKDTILGEAGEGAAIVISSHQLDLVEELCSTILVMREGRGVARGTMDEIRASRPEYATMKLEQIFLDLTGDAGLQNRTSASAGGEEAVDGSDAAS